MESATKSLMEESEKEELDRELSRLMESTLRMENELEFLISENEE